MYHACKAVHLARSNRTHQNLLDLPMRNGEHGILQGCADTIEIIQYLKGLISSQTHSGGFIFKPEIWGVNTDNINYSDWTFLQIPACPEDERDLEAEIADGKPANLLTYFALLTKLRPISPCSFRYDTTISHFSPPPSIHSVMFRIPF